MSQSLNASPAFFGDLSIDHAIAGFGAGTVATLVMHPLDLVKVRFQLAETPRASSSSSVAGPSTAPSSSRTTLSSSSAPTSSASRTKPRLGTGVYNALAEAVQADGWKGLYRGLVPNLVGGASSWGLYFLLYNMIKKQMQGDDPTYRTSSGQHLLAAAEASAVTAMVTNPIWVVKTRVFATGRSDPAYGGLWTLISGALSTIYTREGIRGLYKGSLLALVGVSNGSIQFATYEAIKRQRADIKRRLYEKQGKEWKVEDEKLTNMEYILASGSSKLVAIALTYPYQVVRARIQNGVPPPPTISALSTAPTTSSTIPPAPHPATPAVSTPRLTIPGVIASMYRNEGLLSFYKGLGTNALRILPGTCTTFVVYENLVWLFRAMAIRREEGRLY